MKAELIKKFVIQIATFYGTMVSQVIPRRLTLCYHSLRSDSEHEQGLNNGYIARRLSLDVKLFEAQLRWLSTFATFVTLDQLFSDKDGQEKSNFKIAVTFDDGYQDNILLALPLLEKYRVPVTWFISTGFVENPYKLPWWNLLDFITEHYQGEFKVKNSVGYSRYDLLLPAHRTRFVQELSMRFKNAPPDEYDRLQNEIEECIMGILTLPRNGFASKDDISAATCSPWVTIGGHTVSHLNVAYSHPTRLESELIESREKLQAWTGQKLHWFAYPYGFPASWNNSAIDIVRSSGYKGAVTTVPGYLNRGIECNYQIPRRAVQSGWDFPMFKAQILGLDVFRLLKGCEQFLKMREKSGSRQ